MAFGNWKLRKQDFGGVTASLIYLKAKLIIGQAS